jgi:hypothetical protein
MRGIIPRVSGIALSRALWREITMHVVKCAEMRGVVSEA